MNPSLLRLNSLGFCGVPERTKCTGPGRRVRHLPLFVCHSVAFFVPNWIRLGWDIWVRSWLSFGLDYGAAFQGAERRKRVAYPELSRGGPQKLLVLGREVGGRWSARAQRFVRDLVRLRALRAPPAVRAAASAGWSRRWWGTLSVAVQLAVTSTALGRPWPAARNRGRATAPCWTMLPASWHQPSPSAALSRDRAWQRENLAVAPGFGD